MVGGGKIYWPNRIQANVEYPSMSLGAKIDPQIWVFTSRFIQQVGNHCLKLYGALNLGKKLFSFQLCRSSGLSRLAYTLTHISILLLVYQKSLMHCFSQGSFISSELIASPCPMLIVGGGGKYTVVS